MIINPLLDGSRYISGIWRLLDSTGNIHSIISGKGPLGWFYGYAAYKPDDGDTSFAMNYIDGAVNEAQCDEVIQMTLQMLFDSDRGMPELHRQHYFEVRSNDADRIRKMFDLAISLPLNLPL